MFYRTQKKIQMILLYEIGFFFIFLFSILSNIVHNIFCDYQIAHNGWGLRRIIVFENPDILVCRLDSTIVLIFKSYYE